MRLIDADNFVNNLKLMLNRSRLGEISPHESISIGELATLIKDEPTAYDVDKVKKRLKEEISTCLCEKCDKHTDCDTCRAERAVEIVTEALN